VWLDEIKHEGFQVIAFEEGARVKVYTASRSHGRLRSRPCIIDLFQLVEENARHS
jgi:hypothetical protein